jgi:tripeptide aminopeptidase
MRKETKVVRDAIDICKIKAPTFDESRRANYLNSRLAECGFKTNISKINNVYAKKGDGKPIVVAAHLDTVFDLSVEIKPKINGGRLYAPGFIDNSLGLAGLLYLAREIEVKDQALLLVATAGEEGIGNLIGAKEIFEKEDVLEFIALEGIGLNKVSVSGPGSIRYQVTVKGPGGHSWIDRKNPSAVHELIKFLNQFIKLKDKEVTVNIGLVSGGERISEIAGQAKAEIEIRSINKLDQAILDFNKLKDQYIQSEVDITFKEIGRRPGGIAPSSELYQQFLSIRNEFGLSLDEKPVSSDANAAYAENIPALTIGLTTGGNLHSLDEYADLGPLTTGLEVLKRIVQKRVDSGSWRH